MDCAIIEMYSDQKLLCRKAIILLGEVFYGGEGHENFPESPAEVSRRPSSSIIIHSTFVLVGYATGECFVHTQDSRFCFSIGISVFRKSWEEPHDKLLMYVLTCLEKNLQFEKKLHFCSFFRLHFSKSCVERAGD